MRTSVPSCMRMHSLPGDKKKKEKSLSLHQNDDFADRTLLLALSAWRYMKGAGCITASRRSCTTTYVHMPDLTIYMFQEGAPAAHGGKFTIRPEHSAPTCAHILRSVVSLPLANPRKSGVFPPAHENGMWCKHAHVHPGTSSQFVGKATPSKRIILRLHVLWGEVFSFGPFLLCSLRH